MSTTKLPLKLLINTTSNKVLFAEANKDVIDFLFGLLEMPLGSIMNLLTSTQLAPMAGSMGILHNSIKELDATYLQSDDTKATLVDTSSITSSLSHSNLLLPNIDTNIMSNKKFYRCSYSYSHSYVCDVYGTSCPECSSRMKDEVSYVIAAKKNAEVNSESNGGKLGFVKGVVTYTIMDDLSISPMSTISGITMLNKYNVKDVGALKEEIVHIGLDEGLALLRASLQSRSVLTDVFLKDVK